MFKKLSLKGRFSKILVSSGTSIILKAVSFFCTFLLTKLIIGSYGSEINGMIGSITQFLALITLLEGGVGGVARAALYKPLAQNDYARTQKIIAYLERFFRILAFGFIAYAVCVASFFPIFSNNKFLFTFTLVLIISASIFCEYFFGMTYAILLSADQKNYVSNIVTFIVTVLNFASCVILIKLGFSIHVVKFVSVFVLALRPILLACYCRKKYHLVKVKLNRKENLLPDKWSGFGVHVAYYLHRNTDTFLITLFFSLSMVSVYSVYNMVISGILTVIGSLSIGIESAFGNMYANKEYENLKNKFKLYVFYYQILCTFLFSATFILILPFVKIYTSGFTDANYYQPLFALVFVVSEFFYCLRVPYNDLMVATNSFKKIRWGAYLEAIINIAVSAILMNVIGLVGVAIGTLCAMFFRLVHFLVFFKKHDLKLDVSWFVKITIVSFLTFALNFSFSRLLNFGPGASFASWSLYAVVVCVFDLMICFLMYSLFCNRQIRELEQYIRGRITR